MNNKNLESVKEILQEILISAHADDQKLKSLDKSIDPSSHSRTIYLALMLKELIYEEN
jgi:hypothetical protein